MLPSNNEIRKKYIQILEEICVDESFIEFMEMLSRNNFSLKIEHEITYQRLEDELHNDERFNDISTISYLYDYVFLDEVVWRTKLKKSDFVLSAKERAEKFYELSQKIIFLYRKGLLTKLEKEVFDTEDIIEIKWAKGNLISDNEILEMVGSGPFQWPEIIYNLIVFSIDGIDLFLLGGNRYFTNDDTENFIKEGSNKEYFINKVRGTTDLYNITEFEWFSHLSDKSKNLIESGQQYLDLVVSKKANDIKDFSPLLLNFSKALEVEIKEYYNKHFSLICPLADLINANSELLLKTTSHKKYRLQGLIGICKEISRFKEQYHPSGHKPLPYILHYLGLGKELEETIGIKGFLDGDEKKKALKETAIIERLFETSNNRNKYVHELLIESKNEFLLYHSDIINAFTLLASLK
jgi:hypothetical protein